MKKNKKFIITAYGLISVEDILNNRINGLIRQDPAIQKYLSQLEEENMKEIAKAWAIVMLPDLRNSPITKQIFMDDLLNGYSKTHVQMNDDGSYTWTIPIDNNEYEKQ